MDDKTVYKLYIEGWAQRMVLKSVEEVINNINVELGELNEGEQLEISVEKTTMTDGALKSMDEWSG